jgi:hypothetical protein
MLLVSKGIEVLRHYRSRRSPVDATQQAVERGGNHLQVQDLHVRLDSTFDAPPQ